MTCSVRPTENQDDNYELRPAGVHRWQRNTREPQPCAMEQFFRDQQKLPPHLRSAGALLVCFCPKCRPYC